MAFNQYSNFLKEHTVLENAPEQREIVEIGEQIATAAQAYYEFKGAPEYLKDYAWEYNLVKDPQKKRLVYARRKDCVLHWYLRCSSK